VAVVAHVCTPFGTVRRARFHGFPLRDVLGRRRLHLRRDLVALAVVPGRPVLDDAHGHLNAA